MTYVEDNDVGTINLFLDGVERCNHCTCRGGKEGDQQEFHAGRRDNSMIMDFISMIITTRVIF